MSIPEEETGTRQETGAAGLRQAAGGIPVPTLGLFLSRLHVKEGRALDISSWMWVATVGPLCFPGNKALNAESKQYLESLIVEF